MGHSAARARSVRFRISLLAGAVVAGLLVATAVFVVSDHRSRLTGPVDELLDQRAEDIADLVEDGPIPVALPGEGGGDSLAQLVGDDGRVASASPNMRGEPPLPYRPGDGDDPVVRTVGGVPIDDDDDFRVLSVRVRGDDGERYILHVGLEFDVGESAESLARTLSVVFPSVLIVLIVLVWVMVGRALAPVEQVRSEVAVITGAHLDRRVTVPPGGDEISRLAGTMNEMLERIEEAHRRQQRFVADASHELRSPLTSIRSELEVDLLHPGGSDPLATHRSVLEETERLTRLVDGLLFLARSDAGAVPRATTAVDLDEIVLDEAAALRARGRVAVDTAAVSGAQVRGDADQLRRAVRNLLDNAGRHARSAVGMASLPGGISVEIEMVLEVE